MPDRGHDVVDPLQEDTAVAGDRWLFGYGSLIWRPGFGFAESRDGFVRGYRRRFWQGSPDHRGTPAAPGRVVTLVPEPGAVCWGRGYRIAGDALRDVLVRLDQREQAGYRRITTELYGRDGAPPVGRALVYIADADNPDFVGPTSLAEIADVVRVARGPSGSNRDYLRALARSLAEMGVEDEEVTSLVDLVERDPPR